MRATVPDKLQYYPCSVEGSNWLRGNGLRIH